MTVVTRQARWTVATLAALLCSATASAANAELDPAERGHAIYAERDRRDAGYRDQRADMQMLLHDPGGRTAHRALTVTEIEGVGAGGDRRLVEFSAPRDIADTALLTHEQRGADDDNQWLYLPAYKKTRRIASGGRGGRFVGTEFSYEDLAGDPVEDFSYRYLREETRDGRLTHVIERFPRNRHSAYGRQMTWVDDATRQLVRAELFDNKGRHVKTLEALDWRRYDGRWWRPHRVRMTHLESGRWTEMTVSGYRFDTGVRQRDLRPAALGR